MTVRSITLAGCLMAVTAAFGFTRPSIASAQSDSESKVSVAILVDISKSFAPLTSMDQAALEQLEHTIEHAATSSWEPPVSIYWATIGNSGILASSALCGSALFHPRMVSPRSRTNEFSSLTQLQPWFRECIRLVVNRKPEDYTDISGSVALAAENTRRMNGRKFIVIFSDFAEDLPPGTKQTAFKLSGETIVMLYRAQRDDASNGNLLFSRLDQWEERFSHSGAKSTCRKSIVGATSNTFADCF